MRTAIRPLTAAALVVAASACLSAGPAQAVPRPAGPPTTTVAAPHSARAAAPASAPAVERTRTALAVEGTRTAPALAAERARAARVLPEDSDPPDTRLDLYPATVVPGSKVTVHTLACGVRSRAAGDASAVGAGMFKLAVGTHDEVVVGSFVVPSSASPGTYAIRARCADGKEVSGDLLVSLTAPTEPVNPKGHVKTGVGGALGPDPVQTAAGVAALAVAAAGGTWLLHRRARGDGI